VVKQALGFNGLPFDPFSLFNNSLVAMEVDICRDKVCRFS
jgi:hypothetical protein